MGMWLAVQPPGALLLMGGFLGVIAVGVCTTVYRFYHYFRYVADQPTRERAFLAAVIAAGGVGVAGACIEVATTPGGVDDSAWSDRMVLEAYGYES
ncbi:hypothetical protein [Stenotrophomonas sp. 278]|uniref:hypothetical protein n=1 Tax=Stenotrophomonas sp. 278 TaxID=2479851 RepID=UPI000F669D97|nr:hypothetical protein [Stenotrophomonas sp. 278]RRU12116.1 hypothetical protein EGJ34_12520 [Stenotrophomonas sp. 278]